MTVHSSIILHSKKVETAQLSIKDGIAITMEYYSVIKRDEVLIHAIKWMNLKNYARERSQPQKVTYCMIPFR